MLFTAAYIAALIGTIMTLFFAYFPKVRVWYASLAVENQSLLSLGLMVVVAGAMFGLSFTSIFPPPLQLPQLLAVIVALILTNKPISQILPAPADVRAATLARTLKFLGK